jgi:predicted nucleic acid-binding protein
MSDLAMDACCLINLRAAGRILIPGSPPETVVPSKKVRAAASPAGIHPLDLTFHVPDNVLKEALRLDQPDPEDPTKIVSVPLDSDSLIKQGLLQACKLESDEERERFVQFATELDDGEAACLAIAVERGWVLGSDDKIAARIALSVGVSVMTTEHLVKRWTDLTNASPAEIGVVLQNIQTFGHYTPRRVSPLREWWLGHASKS